MAFLQSFGKLKRNAPAALIQIVKEMNRAQWDVYFGTRQVSKGLKTHWDVTISLLSNWQIEVNLPLPLLY